MRTKLAQLAAAAVLVAACGAGSPGADRREQSAAGSPSASVPATAATPSTTVPASSPVSPGPTVSPADDRSSAPSSTTSAAPASASAAASIAIVDFAFEPTTVRVAPGTTVTWTNDDSVDHTVTSGPADDHDGRFDSGVIEPGQSFSFVFEAAGSYSYFCDLHPRMTGVVEVEQ